MPHRAGVGDGREDESEADAAGEEAGLGELQAGEDRHQHDAAGSAADLTLERPLLVTLDDVTPGGLPGADTTFEDPQVGLAGRVQLGLGLGGAVAREADEDDRMVELGDLVDVLGELVRAAR